MQSITYIIVVVDKWSTRAQMTNKSNNNLTSLEHIIKKNDTFNYYLTKPFIETYFNKNKYSKQ